jgi:hypothetical protein
MSNIGKNTIKVVLIEEKDKYAATIGDYARNIANIWPLDKEKPAVYYWHYVVKHAAKICESVRRNNWHIAAESLGELVVWWLGFMYKVTTKPDDTTDPEKIVPYIDAQIDDIIWSKYPGFCPACFSRKVQENRGTRDLFYEVRQRKRDIGDKAFDEINVENNEIQEIIKELQKSPRCTCLGKKREIEERFESETTDEDEEEKEEDFKKFVSACLTAYSKEIKDEKPKSMNGFCDLFGKIYENNVEVLSIQEIAFHLLEEVGEVSTALTELFTMDLKNENMDKQEAVIRRRWKVQNFAEELADIFSWSNSLWCKINRYLNCAKLLLRVFSKRRPDAMPVYNNIVQFFDTMIPPNPVALIWELHRTSSSIDQKAPKKGTYLGCEKCRHITCDREHEKHKNERGFIKGKLASNEVEILLEGSKI